MEKGAFSEFAVIGAKITVRVTPNASRNSLRRVAGIFSIRVTTVPENGKATREVTKLLARALGVAPSRLALLRGTGSREKVFRLD
ncbi:MAG: DUF167 domain-containing protein [Paracoccaceae bacterium]